MVTCECWTSEEVESEGDVVLPVKGVDADTAGDHGAVEHVGEHGIGIRVTREHLGRHTEVQ